MRPIEVPLRIVRSRGEARIRRAPRRGTQAPEGSISFETELPAAEGERVVLVRRDGRAGRPNGLSWAWEFSVDLVSPRGTRRIELRKACITFVKGKTLTAYGKAPEKRANELTAAWNTVLQTIGESVP